MLSSVSDHLLNEGCVMYGECGKKSFFSSPYNCYVQMDPKQPSTELRTLLIDVCGLSYSKPSVCCDLNQLNTLASSMKTVENFVGACPACLSNLKSLWCDYICSPNQITFINVTEVSTFANRAIVKEVEFYLDSKFSDTLYSSCKDIKFGPDNRFVMEFIGNSAKTPQDFLDFMGQPKDSFGGSPIPIHFPNSLPSSSSFSSSDFQFHIPPSTPCNTTDPSLRCSCMDCDLSCPILPSLPSSSSSFGSSSFLFQCHVGSYHCMALIGLIGCLALLFFWATFFIYRYFRYRYYSSLSQASPGDTNDELEAESYPVRITEDGLESEPETEASSSPPPPPLPSSVENTPPSYLTSFLSRSFYHLGYFCAKYTLKTFVLVCLVCLASSLGLVFRSPYVVTDPIGLWVPPTSPAAHAKALFDKTLGPFYRIQQILFSTTHPNMSILTQPNLKFLFQLQESLVNLKAKSKEGEEEEFIHFTDLCFQPLPSKGIEDTKSKNCVIESVAGYWQNDLQRFEGSDWLSHLTECINHPAQFECLPPFQRPLSPEHIVNQGMNSTGMFITIVNKNSPDSTFLSKSLAWESALSEFLTNLKLPQPELHLSFTTASSVENEVRRSTQADFPTILLSYLAMFFYIVVQLNNPSLGIIGVGIVVFSVTSALGLFAWLQWPVNFVVLEVIPFLALAIGVDNIFLLMEGYHQVALFRSIPERIALALSQRGPGCFMCFLMELCIFLTASLIPIPVVSDFALSAAFTLIFLFFLQFTFFVASMSVSLVPEMKHHARAWTYHLTGLSTWKTPLLWTCLFFFLSSSLFLFNFKMGLDQREALPKHSTLRDYFNDLDEYYHVGPPVYFMIQNANLSNLNHLEALCSKFTSCQSNSIPNILEQERKRPSRSYLISPVTTWLDDFLIWLRPSIDETQPSCCSFKKKVPSIEFEFDSTLEFCSETDPASLCQPCVSVENWQLTNLSRLHHNIRSSLPTYLKQWTIATPSENCPLAGGASSHDTVHLDTMTFAYRLNSVPLKSQSDYIQAYTTSSNRIINELQHFHPEFSISVYSIFHAYFAQYPPLLLMTFKLSFVALLLIFWISFFFLHSFRAAFLLTFCMTLFTLFLSNLTFGFSLVPLNAVSVSNLIMGIGLGVEFSAHLIKSFFETSKPLTHLVLQVHATMFSIGSSVLSGIGWTKLVGIVVLAFAQAPFFRMYYFTMYLCILIAGLVMAFVFLPLFLYFWGGKDIESTLNSEDLRD